LHVLSIYLGFENPGVQLPESIITWVAIRGMPEFMLNLRFWFIYWLIYPMI